MLDILINQVRVLKYKLTGRFKRASITTLSNSKSILPQLGETDIVKRSHKRTNSLMLKRSDSIVSSAEFIRTARKPITIQIKGNAISKDLLDLRNSIVKSNSLKKGRNSISQSEVNREEDIKLKTIIQERIEKIKKEFRVPQKTYNAEVNLIKANVNTSKFYQKDLKEIKSKFLLDQAPGNIKHVRGKSISYRDSSVIKNANLNKEDEGKITSPTQLKLVSLNSFEKKFGIFSKRKSVLLK
jgi:hypothetical protein